MPRRPAGPLLSPRALTLIARLVHPVGRLTLLTPEMAVSRRAWVAHAVVAAPLYALGLAGLVLLRLRPNDTLGHLMRDAAPILASAPVAFGVLVRMLSLRVAYPIRPEALRRDMLVRRPWLLYLLALGFFLSGVLSREVVYLLVIPVSPGWWRFLGLATTTLLVAPFWWVVCFPAATWKSARRVAPRPPSPGVLGQTGTRLVRAATHVVASVSDVAGVLATGWRLWRARRARAVEMPPSGTRRPGAR